MQYTIGAAAAPLVGIAGEETAVPLGMVALSVSALASVAFLTLVRPAVRVRTEQVLPDTPPPA